MTAPLVFRWDGEAMTPATSMMSRKADERYVIGETYQLAEQQDRSAASHRHYFASIHEAWLNLPEHLAERFVSSEHLRRYALIRAGYCDSSTLVASSKAEAQRLAAFIRPADEFQLVSVKDATVIRFVAKSQSVKAMGKEDFQKSKDAVLNIISEMIGTDAASLNQARAA